MVLKRGNVQAMDMLLDRLEGKVIERHELEGSLPITLVFQPVARPTLGEGAGDRDTLVVDAPEVRELPAPTSAEL